MLFPCLRGHMLRHLPLFHFLLFNCRFSIVACSLPLFHFLLFSCPFLIVAGSLSLFHYRFFIVAFSFLLFRWHLVAMTTGIFIGALEFFCVRLHFFHSQTAKNEKTVVLL